MDSDLEGEVSEESEDKDGDDNNNDDDDGLSMFCTPNFGDDDFDLNLLGQSKESCFTPQPGNHSNPTDLGYSAPDYWLPAQPIGQFSVMETAVTSQSSFARDSILESLQSIAPKFPSQEDLDIPDISVTNSLNSQPQTFSQSILSTGISVSKMYKQNGQTSLATTARQSPEPRQISPAPSTSSTVSPSKESSEDSDDSLPLAQLAKRQINDEILSTAKPSTKTGKAAAALKKATRVPKKRKKKDPNEPQKPVSAYALFFRDTQSAIKGQNPSASFGEVSKIVASMWEGLDPETKNMYKKRTEMAKKEYLKQLAAYRASLVSQVATDEPGHSPARHSPLGASSHQMMAHMAENPMEGPFGFNNVSPQHMGSPAHNISPHHMPSPLHMPSPQHMGGQQHVTSPVHASSPHHIPSPQHIYSPQHIAASPQHIQNAQHMPSPQHMASPQHMTSPQHATSPQHIPSPQHPAAFTFNNVPHQPSPLAADMGGYNSVGGGEQTRIDEPAVEQQLQPTIPTGRVFAGMCIRNGCTNRAIDNKGWDNEYCSNECVVSHCRDVFSAWVSSRQHLSMPFPVK